MIDLTLVLTLAAALGAAVVGGLFFAFSTFVMRGLHETGPLEATRTMQAINRTVIRPSVMGVFLGTAPLAIIVAILHRGGPGFGFAVAGAASYVVGTLAVTIVFNVPRNESLGRVPLETGSVEGPWSTYYRNWTRWNHVRAWAAVAAAGLMVLAISNGAIPA
jgi:uncharacterized membrane protein